MVSAKPRRFTKGELKLIGQAIKGSAPVSTMELLTKVGATVYLPRLGWRVTQPARDQYFAAAPKLAGEVSGE